MPNKAISHLVKEALITTSHRVGKREKIFSETMGSATILSSNLSGKILVMVLMVGIVLNTCNNGVTAIVSPNINSTSNTIADQDVDLEFQMDSEINRRVLQTSINFQTAGTSNPNQAALCGRERYRSCTGSPSPGPVKDSCSTYKRNCPINR